MCSHSVRERIACGSCIDYIIIPLCRVLPRVRPSHPSLRRVFTLCKTAKIKVEKHLSLSAYGFNILEINHLKILQADSNFQKPSNIDIKPPYLSHNLH